MAEKTKPKVAIVDYGMGNLFSVRNACESAGLNAEITADKKVVLAADAVILPGVGAFGDAMAVLRKKGLDRALHKVAESGKPLVGICLGMQMLMDKSFEFGLHKGLGIIKGKVIRFENPRDESGPLKVPHVGWNRICMVKKGKKGLWEKSLLKGIKDGAYMYFVHSFRVVPEDKSIVLSTTKYGNIEFCSSLRKGNIFAFQHHPERSGTQGLKVYSNLADLLKAEKEAVK